ncbi:MAG: hypothetical protein MRY83_00765 [Flavobacteriales bacterium]|nr:hypothetical protein [Flavobacteriales bacterium]
MSIKFNKTMGLFGKLKNLAGIGGVKIKIEAPAQVDAESGTIKGVISATTKSDQYLLDLTVTLEEVVTTGRGDNKETEVNSLGEIKMDLNIDIATGEEQLFEFELPFKLTGSNISDLAKKGGALGAVGRLGAMAANEKIEHRLVADLDVKNVALDPSDEAKIILN